MAEEKEYLSFNYDRTLPGRELKIERTVYRQKYDITELLKNSKEGLQELLNQSAESEKVAYEIVQAAANQWEKAAAKTQLLVSAMEYLQTPTVTHTGNQWTSGRNGERVISNAVYKMTCRLDESTVWNTWKSNGIVTKWNVRWNVSLNSPRNGHDVRIAGQERSFTEKEQAEKYLRGRIHAYEKLFSEISPPMPKEYAEHFTVSEKLLPGYRIEGEEPTTEKSSVLGQLAKQQAAAQTQTKKAAEVGGKKKEDIQR